MGRERPVRIEALRFLLRYTGPPAEGRMRYRLFGEIILPTQENWPALGKLCRRLLPAQSQNGRNPATAASCPESGTGRPTGKPQAGSRDHRAVPVQNLSPFGLKVSTAVCCFRARCFRASPRVTGSGRPGTAGRRRGARKAPEGTGFGDGIDSFLPCSFHKNDLVSRRVFISSRSRARRSILSGDRSVARSTLSRFFSS